MTKQSSEKLQKKTSKNFEEKDDQDQSHVSASKNTKKQEVTLPALKKQYHALEKEFQCFKDNVLRQVADERNRNHLLEKDLDNARKHDGYGCMSALIPALDAFDAVLMHESSVPDGIRNTYDLLHKALERSGLSKITPTVGDAFDPHCHEAMMQELSHDLKDGSIVKILRTGYKLRERILRPAQICIARHSTGTEKKEQ